MARIVLDQVTKVFGRDVVAVDGVSFDIDDGECMVLVGPSGCGKSTILRLVAGLEQVTAGEIWIGDRLVTDLLPRDRDVAMVFQNYAIYPHMTVAQNIGFGLKIRGVRKAEASRKVEEVARILGLQDLQDRKPAELSGGQRQRVAMGRAMIREPEALLLDEPLSNLDAKLRIQMRAELARIHERLRTTMLYVTHDQIEAMTLGDRVAVLNEGVVQQVDRPQGLFNRPANVFVAAFIGSPPMNMVEATLDGDAVMFGPFRLPLPQGFDLRGAGSSRLVLGIRPSDIRSADAAGAAGLPMVEVMVEMVEDLGSELNVMFRVEAPRFSSSETIAATSEGEDEEPIPLVAAELGSAFTARMQSGTDVRAGAPAKVGLDPDRYYLFDPETGESVWLPKRSPVAP